EDGIRDFHVTGVQTCALPISGRHLLRYLRQPEVLLNWGIDAVEIYNAGSVTPGNNLLAGLICRHLPLPTVGNSDAHTLSAIGCEIGRASCRERVQRCDEG